MSNTTMQIDTSTCSVTLELGGRSREPESDTHEEIYYSEEGTCYVVYNRDADASGGRKQGTNQCR